MKPYQPPLFPDASETFRGWACYYPITTEHYFIGRHSICGTLWVGDHDNDGSSWEPVRRCEKCEKALAAGDIGGSGE